MMTCLNPSSIRLITLITLLLFLPANSLFAAGRSSSAGRGTTTAGNGRLVSMTFEFVDACDDEYSPEIEFYLKENPSRYWGTFWLQYFNEPLKSSLSCELGKEICFGAWLQNTSWGCGKKCAEPAKGACFVCQNATISVGLTCNGKQ